MSWEWYSVKTLYRVTCKGRPKRVDANYDAEGTLVVERVVLFRARSFDDAIVKAERDALRYAADGGGRNSYGQRIVIRYMGSCDAHAMGHDAIGTGREIYSTIDRYDPDVSDDQ